jgi:predicted DNA-binding transcriptional regulator AlpA
MRRPAPPVYFTRNQLCRRLQKSLRTLIRWSQDPALGLPAPVEIKGRLLYPVAEIEAWEASRRRPRKAAPAKSKAAELQAAE